MVVNGICNCLHQSIRSECNTFVDMHGDKVIDVINQKRDPQHACQALRTSVVNHNMEEEPVIDVKELSDTSTRLEKSKATCEVCKVVVDELKKEIKGKRREQIKNLVHKICKKVTRLVRHECHKFVNKYGDRVIDMLLKKIDPGQICHKLSLCRVVVIDTVETNINEPIDISTQTESSKGACKVCKIVMDEVKKEIKGKNEDEIKNLVHGICKNVPKLVRHECHKFVDKYADRVIDMLVKKLDPRQVCHKLNLCQVIIIDVLKINMNTIPDVPIQLENSKDGCKVCKLVMKEIKREIRGKNQEQIKNLVHYICNKVPKPVRHECHKFVEKYGDRVIDMLLNKLDPGQVCNKLSLCQVISIDIVEDLYERLDMSTQLVHTNSTCEMCKAVIEDIKMEIKNKDQNEINKLVEDICKDTPWLFRHECKKYVHNYIDRYIDELLNKLDAEQVCQELTLCNVSSFTIKKFKRFEVSRHSGDM